MINMTVRDERCWGVLPLHMRRERERAPTKAVQTGKWRMGSPSLAPICVPRRMLPRR